MYSLYSMHKHILHWNGCIPFWTWPLCIYHTLTALYLIWLKYWQTAFSKTHWSEFSHLLYLLNRIANSGLLSVNPLSSFIFFFSPLRSVTITGCVDCCSILVGDLLWAVLMTRPCVSGIIRTSAAWRPWVPMNTLLPLWVSQADVCLEMVKSGLVTPLNQCNVHPFFHRFPQDFSLRGDRKCRSNAQSVGMSLIVIGSAPSLFPPTPPLWPLPHLLFRMHSLLWLPPHPALF